MSISYKLTEKFIDPNDLVAVKSENLRSTSNGADIRDMLNGLKTVVKSETINHTLDIQFDQPKSAVVNKTPKFFDNSSNPSNQIYQNSSNVQFSTVLPNNLKPSYVYSNVSSQQPQVFASETYSAVPQTHNFRPSYNYNTVSNQPPQFFEESKMLYSQSPQVKQIKNKRIIRKLDGTIVEEEY